MQDPICHLLGDGTTEFSNEMFDGTFTALDNTDLYTQELLQALR